MQYFVKIDMQVNMKLVRISVVSNAPFYLSFFFLFPMSNDPFVVIRAAVRRDAIYAKLPPTVYNRSIVLFFPSFAIIRYW